ncbi:hypothetical protein C8J56DRAFT_1164280 [Mycena floridula]|nr:hypothetical protein C8J56DRAFT_1164280 [Mycena floridula]
MPAQRSHNTRSRMVELSVDATSPPTLAVIAPTPRVFTFPLTHNLDDDTRQSLSPVSSHSPSPFSRPRKLSPSPDADRRPQKGDKDYVKRPPNAFFLFRQQCCEDRQSNDSKKARQAELSKTISQQWKSLDFAARKRWEDLALQKKREHEKMYPDYVYRPQRARDDNGKLIRRSKSSPTPETDATKNVNVVIPKRRATSAPGPPLPYHMIQVPNVYVAEPPPNAFNSAPASPSLLPMLRRSSDPGHGDFDNFDYVAPNNSGFAFGVQPSEFLTGLVDIPSEQSWSPGSSSALLPGFELASPGSSVGSCSPGPFSPDLDPLTPISGSFFNNTPTPSVLIDSFSQLWGASGLESHVYPGDLFKQSFAKFDEFPPYTQWSGESVLPSSWPDNTQLTLNADDFDLDSIPPLEFGGSDDSMDQN